MDFTGSVSKELKKGSAEMLVLSLVEDRPRHGYEIGRLIGERSSGALNYHVASLYPTLYRLEDHGLIEGRWVERAGQRRRRYYRITAAGRRVLRQQRTTWQQFFTALNHVTGFQRP
jgi:PadR family transcriptional regulator PadR